MPEAEQGNLGVQEAKGLVFVGLHAQMAYTGNILKGNMRVPRVEHYGKFDSALVGPLPVGQPGKTCSCIVKK